ncbi:MULTISPECIES: flagellar brake protein [Cupriavidus]|uniref:Flagellar brake protein n=1 Tax=Cupriavidus pauculus TaxID=82633 RepID=A0A5P2H298_9BURK|nr:flagellar brake protein [Cupriavidus pauculus]QET02071.1 flagellar brake protein [Cupriavidus pauculus]
MIQLSPQDLPVGAPLPWSLLDGDGNLMLGSGCVIPDKRDLALVFRHGVVCRPDELSEAENDPVSPRGGRLSAGPLGLQVGTLLHVKLPGESSRAAASRLIGFIDQGLFVTWPSLGGRELTVQAGETLLLRGFSGQAIHSFTSTVTAACRSPFRYLVLSSPAEAEHTPVRSAARVPTRLAAYLVHDNDDEPMEGLVASGMARLGLLSDLSTGGALIQTSAPGLAIGSRIRLRFRLRTASIDSDVTVNAQVRGAPAGSEDEEFPACGVAFDALGERELTLLQCFIYEQLLSSTRMTV